MAVIKNVAFCLLAALVLLCLLLAPAGAQDWPTFHGDAARNGVAGALPNSGELSVAWAVKLDEESVDSSPAVVAGRVYVGTATGRVVCVTAQKGEKVWEAVTSGAVVSSPTVADGRVFVGSVDRCIYALSADAGKVLWRVRTRRSVVASPLYVAGRIYIGSGDGVFRCLDAATGKTVWEAKEQSEISATAAAADGSVFYGDEAGNFLARSCADGKLSWSVQLSGSIVAAPLVSAGKVLVPVMSRTALSPPPTPCLTVLDVATGNQLWALTQGSSVLHTPVADDQNVYFATVSGYLSDTELLARRLVDGTEVWKKRLGGVVDSSPVLAGQHLMFGGQDCSFYVVDKADGNVTQALPLQAKIFSSPAVSEEAVYVGAQDGKLYCLR
ncbi:MAG: beta-alanine-activating enzyme beta-propeller domain-containing protein [Armatimonadota bacterium]